MKQKSDKCYLYASKSERKYKGCSGNFNRAYKNEILLTNKLSAIFNLSPFNWWGSRASCPRISANILGTKCDQSRAWFNVPLLSQKP